MTELFTFDKKSLPRYALPLVFLAVLGAFALALPFALEWHLRDWRVWRAWPVSLGSAGWFIFLALMPLFLIAVYHLLTAQDRLIKTREIVVDYVERRKALAARRHVSVPDVPLEKLVTKGPASALAATAILSSTFLFVAFINAYAPKGWNGANGIVYAGLGAYVATMYTTVNRLFATAITSRFLMSSALYTASAIVMGYVFVATGVSKIVTNTAAPLVLFLVGLFQPLVFKYLRKRAGVLFSQPEPAEANLPVTLVLGVDENSADLLTEYGVSDVQHLATAEPAELCTRTMLPVLRVLGWIDQAILICILGRKITEARAFGVNDMTALTRTDDDTLNKISQKTGQTLKQVAESYRHEFFIELMHELREGSPAAVTRHVRIEEAVLIS